MKSFTGTVVKQPTVLKKLITTSIKMNNAENPVQIIAFAERCSPTVKHTLSNAKLGDTLNIWGRLKRNPKNNEQEIVVEKILDTEDSKDIVDPTKDFIVGGLSSGGKTIRLSDPKEGCKQYYTDGDYYWYEGNTTKCPTEF